jgi:F0F1-type ATP synthase assembly protein I
MPAFVITGAPALLIILVILGLIITGAVTMVRASARGAKRLTHEHDKYSKDQQ